jgi:NAD(P)-dependent dehydrogenase (short-subunit alcohol dehydrogenase family)
VAAPLEGNENGLKPGATVVITDDGRGIAELVAATIRSRGCRAVLIGASNPALDWTSPTEVEAALRAAHSKGPLAGLIHLRPLRSLHATDLGPTAWTRIMNEDVRGLFLLARALGSDMERAAARGGSCLIAATAMGGQYASAGKADHGFLPGQGAIAGLTKTIAREWPLVRARVVDLDLRDTKGSLADRVVAEALHEDAWTEVGYVRGRRVRLRTVASPLDPKGAAAGFSLSEGEPVMITGGARGITSLVAEELARRWRPTLLLIGSTPAPEGPGDPLLEKLNDPSEIKAALYANLRDKSSAISPATLERLYQSHRREREIRRTLARLRSRGSRVEYAQADVCDTARLSAVVNDWKRRFGDPVGLVHGAGVIRDKLIRDKSLESFDRVVGTKFDGAVNLLGLIDPASLRFKVFFSSIAARFGNRGQSDYAAANEALNKLALWLDARSPGRVVAPIWGPWSGTGMVSELESHLGSRGLEMIAPEQGVAALVSELLYGRKGDVEVVLAGDLGTLAAPRAVRSAALEAAR